jgi:CBS domain-containing protein
MNITDYIQNKIQPLRLNGTAKTAKKLFDEFSVTHLAVVEKNIILGCFSRDDFQSIQENDSELAEHSHLLNSFFADKKTTTLALLRIFSENDTTFVPVLNADKEYIGYYELSDVLEFFCTSPFMLEKSETLIIANTEDACSMSKIAQIVESNNGKLLGMYISKKEQDLIQITLKISSEGLQEIMHTFRRYNYSIISIHENDLYEEDLKSRAAYLQKYLEM